MGRGNYDCGGVAAFTASGVDIFNARAGVNLELPTTLSQQKLNSGEIALVHPGITREFCSDKLLKVRSGIGRLSAALAHTGAIKSQNLFLKTC